MIRLLLLLFCLSANAALFDQWDREAWQWRLNVQANTSNVSGTAYNTATKFMQHTKQFGIRTNLVHVGLYLGTNLTAARMPIIYLIANTGGPMRNEAFVDGDFVETGASGGLTGDGTSKALMLESGSGQVSMNLIGQKAHLGVYVRTGADAAQHVIGATEVSGDSSAYVLPSYVTGLTYGQVNDNVALQWNSADSAGTGLYIATRTAADFAAVYKNGVQISSQSSTVSGTHDAAFTISVHALNANGNRTAWTTKTLSFWTVGFELTPLQNANYYKIVQRVQYDMNRAK